MFQWNGTSTGCGVPVRCFDRQSSILDGACMLVRNHQLVYSGDGLQSRWTRTAARPKDDNRMRPRRSRMPKRFTLWLGSCCCSQDGMEEQLFVPFGKNCCKKMFRKNPLHDLRLQSQETGLTAFGVRTRKGSSFVRYLFCIYQRNACWHASICHWATISKAEVAAQRLRKLLVRKPNV